MTRYLGDAILTRYAGPTNTRGSRIIATLDIGSSSDGRRRVRTAVVGYDDALSTGMPNHARAAEELARRVGWTCQLAGAWLRSDVYVFVPDLPAEDHR